MNRNSIIATFTLTLGAVLLLMTPAALAATTGAAFHLSASGGTAVGSSFVVEVTETSSLQDKTNAVAVKLSYPSNLLTYQKTTIAGPFTLCADKSVKSSVVSIVCASPTRESGTQYIAAVGFQVRSNGTANLGLVTGSGIDNTSGENVWDGKLPTLSVALPVTATPARSSSPSTVIALGSVSVHVVNGKQQAVSGAGVTIKQGAVVRSNQTNASGTANFAGIPAGNYAVTAASGSHTGTSTVKLGYGQNRLVTVKLSGSNLLIWIVVLVVIIVAVIAILYPMLKQQKKSSPKEQQ